MTLKQKGIAFVALIILAGAGFLGGFKDVSLLNQVEAASVTSNFEGVFGTNPVVYGWVFTQSNLAQALRVQLYIDGPKGSGTLVGVANVDQLRSDVNTHYSITGNHGFAFSVPASARGTHTWYAYVIDPASTSLGQLYASPKSITLPSDPAPVPAPVITFAASPMSVTSGNSSTLTWSSTGATSCTASGGWSGPRALSGSQVVSNLTATTVYALTCTGSGGSANKSVTVTVTSVDTLPTGYVDTISSTSNTVVGWTLDKDVPTKNLSYHVYMATTSGGARQFVGSGVANVPRLDVNQATGIAGDHGFIWPIPASYQYDGYVFYVYAINPTAGGANPILSGSPKVYRVAAPIPQPTMSITAASSSIAVGQSTTIRATFVSGAGDTLTNTDINELPASGTEFNLVYSGAAWGTPVQSTLSYTFTPTTPGTYVFKPYVSTNSYPSWQGVPASQWATVTVSAAPATTGNFYVDNYGGRGDGVTDSTTALQNAIRAAVASGKPAHVIFSSGTYLLKCAAFGDNMCFTIDGAHSLTVAGQGDTSTALLIGHPRAGIFSIKNSAGVSFNGFSVDYQTVPVAQGTITAINSNSRTLTISIDSGFPLLDNVTVFPGGLSSAGSAFSMVFDPYGNVRNPNAMFGLTYTPSGGNVFVVHGARGSFKIGDKFIYPVRNYKPSFFFYNSSDASLKNIIQYTGTDVAMQFIGISGNVVIDHFQLNRKSGRILTAPGGAVWARNNTAKFLIQNSHFEGMGDDVLDWHAGEDKGFSATWAAPASSFINNTMGTFRGIVRDHSAGSIIQNNIFSAAVNGLFLVGDDVGPTWHEGPALGANGNALPHFSGNSAGGKPVRYVSPDFTKYTPVGI